MDHLLWSHEPILRRPIIIAAFEGWNDAGDAATTAARYLAKHWQGRAFADIDAECFFDFTTMRPQVAIETGGERVITWPTNRFTASPVVGLDGDAIVLEGTEPALMWRTFCEQIVGLARRFDAQLVLTLGALVSDVPHSRPVQIYGAAYHTDAVERLGVESSTYEGPTGIVGVLHAACRAAEIPSASLWAAVPSYVHGSPSPKAALALVEKVGEILRVNLPTTELQIAAAQYERQVSELIADDDETTDVVRNLESRYDDMDSSDSLVEEVEQFLRNRPQEG